MDRGFPILMLVFAGVLLLYAALIRASKSTDLIMRSQFAKIPDKEAYAKQFSKALAIIALAPAGSALFGLLGQPVISVIVLIGGGIAGIINAIRLVQKVM